MPDPVTLVIANKVYSSWSLRPWLLMHTFRIPFDEVVIPLDTPDTAALIAGHSPAGKLPVLHDGEITLWDSLAIIEYIAERHRDLPLWPVDIVARARARSLTAEMHAGFAAMRRGLPMNMRRTPRPPAAGFDAGVLADIARIEAAWADALARSGGPFLFGAFSATDAMYAPVVNHFHAYAVATASDSRAYMDTLTALPAWHAWRTGAEAEPWRLERIEAV